MKSFKIFLVAACVVFFTQECSKTYLDKDPLGLLDENVLANSEGVERLLIGAYSLLDGISYNETTIGNNGNWGSACSNWIYGSVCGSEAYKGSNRTDQAEISDLELFDPIATNPRLAEKWRAVYDGVQRSNDVLRIMQKATDITPENQIRIAAEARFLRAHYHFEAKKMWNKVPYIDETITYENANYHVSNEKDIWPDIENDLKYAVDNLQAESYQQAVGRANKYTAMALLAKAYMFQKKFIEAKPLLNTIINSNKYKLVNYADNFNPAYQNNAESVFMAQMSVNDGSNGYNGNYGDILNFPGTFLYGMQPGACCGFFQPSQYLANHFKITEAGLPDLDNFNKSDVKSDEGIESSDSFFIPYTGALDPRLDWTVGRRGIPYLDWGNHPGKVWTVDQEWGGPYSPKKNVYYKSQEGILTEGSTWGANGLTTNKVNLIRYADILLWAAEVEIEIGGLDKGQEYINMIRNRMVEHHEYWVHKYLDDNNPQNGFYTDDAHLAANYRIQLYPNGDFLTKGKDYALKALRYERILELAMEGHRFFDLVRWGIADVEINNYLITEKKKRIHLKDAIFKKGCNEYFPIPQKQIDLSAGADGIQKMIQNPCY